MKSGMLSSVLEGLGREWGEGGKGEREGEREGVEGEREGECEKEERRGRTCIIHPILGNLYTPLRPNHHYAHLLVTFPGHSHLQFLITCSMQKQRRKA